MREPESTTLKASSVAEMRAIGAALATAIGRFSGAPIVIAIRGELGAGKTTLVGGLLHALGLVGPARSPTYTLIEPYELSQRFVYHLDLYRLADPSEVEALGLRDLLNDDSLLLIEWPEKGGAFVPNAEVDVAINYAGGRSEGRELRFSWKGPLGVGLQAAFLAAITP